MLTADDVRSRTLRPTRFREGYAQPPVDELRERVAATLDAYARGATGAAAAGDGLVSADQVEAAKFEPSRFGAGYDQEDTDAFLDEVVETLRDHEARASGGRAPDLATFVASAAFDVARLKPGYDTKAVDDLLDAIVRTVRERAAGVSSPDHVRGDQLTSIELPRTRWRNGYDVEQVDALLEHVSHQL
jgi:DivIVA domain-containing protein